MKNKENYQDNKKTEKYFCGVETAQEKLKNSIDRVTILLSKKSNIQEERENFIRISELVNNIIKILYSNGVYNQKQLASDLKELGILGSLGKKVKKELSKSIKENQNTLNKLKSKFLSKQKIWNLGMSLVKTFKIDKQKNKIVDESEKVVEEEKVNNIYNDISVRKRSDVIGENINKTIMKIKKIIDIKKDEKALIELNIIKKPFEKVLTINSKNKEIEKDNKTQNKINTQLNSQNKKEEELNIPKKSSLLKTLEVLKTLEGDLKYTKNNFVNNLSNKNSKENKGMSI